MLIIPMIGIGIAWGSILAMPYAMLANDILQKDGHLHGIIQYVDYHSPDYKRNIHRTDPQIFV